MKFYNILFGLFILLFLIECKYFHNDCRRNDSCPIFYFADDESVYDIKGETLDRVRVPKGAKFLILTDSDGNLILGEGEKGKTHYKALYGDKEIFLWEHYSQYRKAIRVIPSSGVELKEQPNLTSKTITKIPFNATVQLISESDNSPVPRGATDWKKVQIQESVGWILGKDLTEEDYDAKLFGKTIEQIIPNLIFNVSDSMYDVTLKWRGLNFEEAECKIKNEICSVSISINKESTNSDSEYLYVGINTEGVDEYTTITEDSQIFYCKMIREHLLEAYTKYREKSLISPFMNCERARPQSYEG